MNNKKKYQLLWGGIALFSIIAWWLAFGKTWSIYTDNLVMKKQLAKADNAWQEIEYYEQQLKTIEKQNSRPFTPALLFSEVTDFCQQHQLSIIKMPASTIYTEQEIEILQNPIEVQGHFVPMVELIYELEQKQQLGNVVSVVFDTKKNIRSRQKELTATIYLQNIKTQL